MYNFYNPNPSGKFVGDCVIRAICKIEDKEWEHIYIMICAYGFMNHDMPAANHVWGKYLQNNNYTRLGGNWGGVGGRNGYVGAEIQNGFNQSAVMNGIQNISTQVANGFNQAEVGACNRQMNTVQAFNQLGIAGVQGFNQVASGIADLKYTVATEACADRTAINGAIRDVVENATANTQRIIDNQNMQAQAILSKICQIELDALKTKNNEQASEIASLKAQLATIANNAYLINQLKPATTTTAG